MAPLFAHDMKYELSGLRAVGGRLSVPSPRILGEGVLEGWPYVILSHIDGEPIRNIWPALGQSQRLKLAEQIAQVTQEISRCDFDDVVSKRFAWNDFIKHQYDSWEEQQTKKGLSGAWLKHVGDFLRGFEISEFQTNKPVFLHADLTFDHFLVSQEPEPRISGIIDMADCQAGHFEYELVAPAVFIFKGNQSVLERYFTRLGYSPSESGSRFSQKLLAWSILHRYFSMISYFEDEMNVCAPGDFEALAKKVFPLSGEST